VLLFTSAADRLASKRAIAVTSAKLPAELESETVTTFFGN
jgi:hypothetical protein